MSIHGTDNDFDAGLYEPEKVCNLDTAVKKHSEPK